MAMNLTKLNVASGVRYLLNTVATGDRPSRAQGGMVAYYADSGTPPGRWLGAGSAVIGLVDGSQVSHAGAENLFSRFAHPTTGQPLGHAPVELRAPAPETAAPEGDGAALEDPDVDGWAEAGDSGAGTNASDRTRKERAPQSPPTAPMVAGFDLTFRVPKSVSVLWATASPETQAVIFEAHKEAIARTLTWAEVEVIGTRSGRGGAVANKTRGLIAARFDHWESREGDPHLHSHVVVSNRVQRAHDGKWLTLDGRTLYRATVAMSEVHENLLLDELHDRLGLAFVERDRPGAQGTKAAVADVAGVPNDVIDSFSARDDLIRQAEDALIAAWWTDHPDAASMPRRELDRIHQQAWRETRKPKDVTPRPLGELVARWRTHLRRLGADPGHMEAAALGHPVAQVAVDRLAADRPAVEQLAVRLMSGWVEQTETARRRPVESHEVDEILQRPDLTETVTARAAAQVTTTLTGARATWTRANVIAEAERLTRLVRCEPGERRILVDAIVETALAQCVSLTPTRYRLPGRAAGDARLEREAGASVFDDPGARRYTSQATLDAEAALHAMATTSASAGALEAPEAEAHLAAWQETSGRALAPDQFTAATWAVTHRAALVGVVGAAGTGKTTTMAAVKAAWEAEHGPGTVIGLATSSRAVAELSASLAIPAHTVAKWAYETSPERRAHRAESLHRARHSMATNPRGRGRMARWATALEADDATYQIRPGNLVVIDEAAMTGTFDLVGLARQVNAAGARMVLVGDPAQLDSPDAGGVLGWLDRQDQVIRLGSLFRFRREWEADASLRLRRGDHSVLAVYDEAERITDGTDMDMLDGAYAATRTAWSAGRSAVLVAATNDHVADLNRQATLDLRAEGKVDSTHLVNLRAGATAGVGETILARKVDRKVRDDAADHIRNGDLLKVTAIDERGVVTARRLDSGTTFTLEPGWLAQHVELGYAVTAHRAQGLTVDESHLVIPWGARMTRELLYVAMTRGREVNKVWVGLPELDDLRHLNLTADQAPSARGVLSAALTAQGAELTAHETADLEQAATASLGRLAAEHEYLAGLDAAPRLRAFLAEHHGEPVAATMAASPAWDALVTVFRRAWAVNPARAERLARIPAVPSDTPDQGTLFDDPLGAVAPSLDLAVDPAAILHHRLAAALVDPAPVDPDDPAYTAGLVTTIHTDDPALAELAAQNEALINGRMAELRVTACGTTPPGWVKRLDPPPTDHDTLDAWGDMVTAVATYRDLWDVATLAPLGPKDVADRRQRAHRDQVADLIANWSNPRRRTYPDLSAPPEVDPHADSDWDEPEYVETGARPDTTDDVAPAALEQEPVGQHEEEEAAATGDRTHLARVKAALRAAWDHWQRHTTTNGSWTTDYLAGRGLAGAEHGHAPPGWHSTYSHLRGAGFTDAELEAAGLAKRSARGNWIDIFRDRLVFPVYDDAGDVVGFTARANPTNADAGPKYLNTPATELYDKSRLLVGFDDDARARLRAGARPVLVEGAIDVEAIKSVNAAFADAGLDVVPLAACGTSVTAEQLAVLRKECPRGLRSLILAQDPDAPGRKAAMRTWSLLTPEEAATISTTIPLLSEDSDPADLVSARQGHALATALAAPAPMIELIVAQLAEGRAVTLARGEPEAAVGFIRDVAGTTARLSTQARELSAATAVAALVAANPAQYTDLARAHASLPPGWMASFRPDESDGRSWVVDEFTRALTYDVPEVGDTDPRAPVPVTTIDTVSTDHRQSAGI